MKLLFLTLFSLSIAAFDFYAEDPVRKEKQQKQKTKLDEFLKSQNPRLLYLIVLKSDMKDAIPGKDWIAYKEAEDFYAIPITINVNTDTTEVLYDTLKRCGCKKAEYEIEFVLLARDRSQGDRDKTLLDGPRLSAFGVQKDSVIVAGPPQTRAAAAGGLVGQ